MYFTNIKLHNSCLTLSKETYLKYSMTCFCLYNSHVHHYNTRQSHLLHISHVSSNQRKRTLRYEGPVIWNKLQNTVNINCSLCSFKRQLKLLLWNVWAMELSLTNYPIFHAISITILKSMCWLPIRNYQATVSMSEYIYIYICIYVDRYIFAHAKSHNHSVLLT